MRAFFAGPTDGAPLALSQSEQHRVVRVADMLIVGWKFAIGGPTEFHKYRLDGQYIGPFANIHRPPEIDPSDWANWPAEP